MGVHTSGDKIPYDTSRKSQMSIPHHVHFYIIFFVQFINIQKNIEHKSTLKLIEMLQNLIWGQAKYEIIIFVDIIFEKYNLQTLPDKHRLFGGHGMWKADLY